MLMFIFFFIFRLFHKETNSNHSIQATRFTFKVDKSNHINIIHETNGSQSNVAAALPSCVLYKQLHLLS